MKKKEFVIELADKIRDSIPVSVVVGKYMDLKRSGQSFKGLCPFHNDIHLGSFVITDSKKIWKCFSCGEGGDCISFYAKRNHISYIDSVLELALEYNFISVNDYEEFNKRKINKKESYEIEKIYIEKNKFVKKQIANTDVLDKVYRLFIETNKKTLSEKHREDLINKRFLNEEDIKKNNYFSFPTRRIMKPFVENLKENNFDINILKTIPGFFFNKEKKEFDFYSVKNGGIGIPIHNEYGKIVGIQIRRDSSENRKYIWFSSSFADTEENLDFGSSPGAPLDVIIPDDVAHMSGAIFITEGHFKAMAITKKYNSICISVQGVSAWGKIKDTIKNIKDIYKSKKFKAIYIAYDGDIGYNSGVFYQALKMGNALNEEYNIFYTLWDDTYGKGFDDLINSGNDANKIKLTMSEMSEKYKIYLSVLKKVWEENYPEVSNMERIPKNIKKEIFLKYVLNNNNIKDMSA